MLLHQSDLAAWTRCPAQYGYQLAGLPDKTNSASAFGSVMHHALNVFERHKAQGMSGREAIKRAVETFLYYWHPAHISAICEPVPPDGWLPRQNWSALRDRGIASLHSYADLIRFDDHELLATEYSFLVDIEGTVDEDTGRPHQLAGSIDRLAVRHYVTIPTLCIDDYKTGKEYKFLRHNLQFTAYCYATTQPNFWTGVGSDEDGFGIQRGLDLFERFYETARRGTWINLRTFKFQDAGWRGSKDYERFKLAVSQIALSVKADIFPLTISGEACTFCPYRDVCGAIGVPDDDYGNPRKK